MFLRKTYSPYHIDIVLYICMFLAILQRCLSNFRELMRIEWRIIFNNLGMI